MSYKPYGLICPVTRACDVIEPRWTIPILSELWNGVTKFNELRRNIGNISPALLSKRLKELEEYGLIERIEDPATGSVDYIQTQMAIDLEPALNCLAVWAQKYIEAEIACEVDLSSLAWKMRDYIVTDELPKRRVVIRFHFQDESLQYDTYWVVAKPGEPVQICSSIPGLDVDLWVETTVPSRRKSFCWRPRPPPPWIAATSQSMRMADLAILHRGISLTGQYPQWAVRTGRPDALDLHGLGFCQDVFACDAKVSDCAVYLHMVSRSCRARRFTVPFELVLAC